MRRHRRTDATSARSRQFESLRNGNVRKYLIGQGISHVGQWTQQTAELWLILSLTGSGLALGMHAVLRYAPLLIFGLYGGILADHYDRRRAIIITQTLHALTVTFLAVAIWVTSVPLVMIYAVVLVQGIVNAVDNPIRRSFLRDLANDEELPNAVGLLGTTQTVTRAAGPAIAALLITGVGIEWCFTVNAVSYLAVLASLFLIKANQLRPRSTDAQIETTISAIRGGLQYAYRNTRIRQTLVMTALVGIFAWNWNTVLPLYATSVLGGGAGLFGTLSALLGLGSLVGALYSARFQIITGKLLRRWSFIVAVALFVVALAPGFGAAIGGLVLLGAAGTAFSVMAQSRLFQVTDDLLSGRVMALYSIAFVGSKPLGGLLAGVVADLSGARTVFGVGGVVILVAAVVLERQHVLRRARAQVQE